MSETRERAPARWVIEYWRRGTWRVMSASELGYGWSQKGQAVTVAQTLNRSENPQGRSGHRYRVRKRRPGKVTL